MESRSEVAGRSCVLVVDDEPGLVTMCRDMLVPAGYDVESASDGATAVRRAGELLPDVVLLDVMLPALDGWAVLRALRADPRTASVPVVMVTAESSDEDRRRAGRLGANGFLAKPYDEPSLLRAVRLVLHPASC